MRCLSALGWSVATAVVAVGYFVLPDSAIPLIFPFWSTACAAAVLWRAARLRRQVAWWLIGLALLQSALGELLWFLYEQVWGADPFPSLADLFYLSVYPLLGSAFIALVRRSVPGGDRASLVDASVVAVGASALAWVLVAGPHVEAGGSFIQVAVGLAYPLGDLLVLGFLCRLVLARRLGSWSVRLLAIGAVAMLVADVAFLLLDLDGRHQAGHVIDAGWLVWYGLTAAAAWHPSAAAHRAEASHAVDLPPARLALLAVALLMAPVVLVIERARRQTFDVLAVDIVTGVLFLLVLGRMAGLVRQVQAQATTLVRLSGTDQLTGLANRRAWDRELSRAIATARRSSAPLAVALVDVDHFKRVNDTRGHAAGDRLLAAAAAAWAATLRAGDLLARYGGEEFVVLLPDSDAEAAVHAAERIRLACPDGETCSVGVAVLAPVETAEDLVGRADAALYAAKRAGRNRTALAEAAVDTETSAAAASPSCRDGKAGPSRAGTAGTATPVISEA